MRKRTYIYEEYYIIMRKKYGFMNFLLDCLMTGITGGLWLIWVFAREMRAR
jgi:hypothetical protein